MLTPLDIRDAAVAQEVFALQRLAYQREAELIAYPDLPPLRESLQALLRCNEHFLGWRVDGALLGALAYTADGSEFLICRLVVAPSALRRGIGRSLLCNLIPLAGQRHIRVCTASRNAPALALYHEQGFALDREQTLADGLQLSHLLRVA